MPTAPPRLRLALLLGAMTVLVAASASLVVMETAAVMVVIPPQRLTATVVLNTAAPGNSINVQRLVVAVTDTAQGTGSSVTIAPAYATGAVTFIYACSLDPCQAYTLAAGTVVSTTKGHVRFATVAPVTFGPNDLRPSVAIRALAIGAAGNVGPAWINVIENPPTQVVRVFNPYATSGGVDGRVAQIVQQSDMDMVLAALAPKIQDEVAAAMSAKATGMTYLLDAPPVTAFAADHAVGDETPTFTVTATAKLGARAFSNSEAQVILRHVLQPMVWSGYRLADPIHASYQIDAATGDSLVVKAVAVGYAVPGLSSETERVRLKGMGVSEALARLHHDFPGSSADIRTQPLGLPWLPFIADHINLTMVVNPAA
jgi:baseplate J-like protein